LKKAQYQRDAKPTHLTICAMGEQDVTGMMANLQPWTEIGGRTQALMLSHGHIRLHEVGAGQPIIFIHGWGMGAAAFDEQGGLAQHGFHLIAPDLPGFAGTGSANGRATLSDYASLVQELTLKLGLNKPVLVGWSMGASIAWLAASQWPQLFGGVISLDMSPCPKSALDWDFSLIGGYGEAECAYAVQAMQKDWSVTCQAFLPRVVHTMTPQFDTLLAPLAAASDPPSAAIAWQSLALTDLRPVLARLSLPMLAIHGAKSALYPSGTAQALCELNTHCTGIIVENAGHAPHLEAPEVVNAAIARFASFGEDQTMQTKTALTQPASSGLPEAASV
jgi:pimeloyl-[acyl-carrier protein] methyl ester esterase